MDPQLYTLSSGFTVSVTPLPPYYLDVVNDAIPLMKYPMRKVQLMAGDIGWWPYKPPDSPPDESDTEEYELYMQWHAVAEMNEESEALRKRAKRDFLLSLCVNIESGPGSPDDDEWVQRVEGAFEDFKVPTHEGRRRLLFLKMQVVLKVEEMEAITRAAIYKEVDMGGVADALRGFGLKWKGTPILEAASDKAGELEHNMRFWESITAEANDISFDDQWYRLPLITRTQMVATQIGSMLAESLAASAGGA